MSEKPNPSVTPETVGQQPQWPGEKNRMPGKYDKTSKKADEQGGVIEEETRIPTVDSKPNQDP